LQDIIDQLTLGSMPPEDSDQPSDEQRLNAITQFTSVLASMRQQTSSTGGQSVLRRLSRREYRNTILDLLSIDMAMFDPTLEFPADNLSQNADNFGDALVTSGHLLEKYLDAADRCVEKVLAVEPQPQAKEWIFKDHFTDESDQNTLSNHGLAERLSYFLTSTMPDAHLRTLADEGRLDDVDTLRAEAKRLLSLKTSDAFVSDFLDSWLNLRALGTMLPDPDESQVYYAAGLEPEMKEETRLFMRYLIDHNASLVDFLQADYSFVNRDLAKLYGVQDQVPVDAAADFHRVVFKDTRRGGLLGQASILTVSANGIETSPVTRGVWLLENILGLPTPPPPDEVPEFDPDVRGALSIRDQLVKHRESAACSLCHRKIDPLGFAFEGFDPIGRARTHYDSQGSHRIDTSGVLPGGDSFAGPAELRMLLVKRKEFFVRTVTNRLVSDALGRRIDPVDRAEIDRIIAHVRGTDYPTADLITAIVASDLFRQR